MNSKELANIARQNGIVGAGGAGFPTYGKIDSRAKILLLNCAECEPLLKLHRQLLCKHTDEILQALRIVKEAVEAESVIIGIKEEYQETVAALKARLGAYEGFRMQLLDSAYPMGDEVVLIYEATGRVVRPGGLPIEEGIAVFNVETMYNLYRAIACKEPVTDKLVSVVGEVYTPITLRVPLGASLEECVAAAGGAKVKDPVYLVGGPMMGAVKEKSSPVTKTTNAVSAAPVKESRKYRKAPEERLEARLGLSAYDVEAPLVEERLKVERAVLPLSQHIGAPAVAVVRPGESVTQGQLLGEAAQGLSVPVHAPFSGRVTDVSEKTICLVAEEATNK